MNTFTISIKLLSTMRNYKLSFLILLSITEGAISQDLKNSPFEKLASNSNVFIENRGQFPFEVLYMAKLKSANAWITRKGIVYDLYSEQLTTSVSGDDYTFNYLTPESETINRSGQVIRINIQSDLISEVEGISKSETYFNFINGNNPVQCISFVPLYHEIYLKNIFNGIDQRYYFEGNNIRYDYVIKPNADPTELKFEISGSENFFINDQNELIIKTRFGWLKQNGLFAYQLINGFKQKVNCQFEINGNTIGFNIDNYDKSKSLVIDPLVYSTYLGGNGDESLIYAIDVDHAGNAYVTGRTSSNNYPVTTGSYDETFNGGSFDIYLSKLNSAGDTLIYSTFIGGNGMDQGYSVKVDNNENVFLTGDTYSSDFPTTSGTLSQSLNGLADAFLIKLNSSGSALLYSTLLGGTSVESSKSLAIDDSGNAYLTGATNSNDLPVTTGAFDETANGNATTPYDVFVAKINSTATAILFCTYIGGTSQNGELATSIKIDLSGNSYLTGYTFSTDFPVTSGAYDESHNSPNNNNAPDLFICKLNSTGTGLIYSTFAGGIGSETGISLAIDVNENVYVTGTTTSLDFPVTAGAYDETFNGGLDIFITKLNANGNALLYSTLLGTVYGDVSRSIVVDNLNQAYITGSTSYSSFPTTANAFDQTYNDLSPNTFSDAFISVLNDSGTALTYSTFLGGTNIEVGNAICLDQNNNVYVTGKVISSDFPVTSGSIDETFNGGNDDLFVARLDISNQTGFSDFISENIFVHPNPSANNMVQFSGIFYPVEIMITDASGKIIGIKSMDPLHNTIDVSSLNNGIYFAIIKSGSSSTTQKFVIQK